MGKTPLDLFKIIYPKLQRKHPNWSTAHLIRVTEWAVQECYTKEKTKQNICEISKPYQISFEDLMKRGTQYV